MKLSVIIIVKNEARVLQRCLHSVRFADEIIVLDSGSTDATVAIAKAITPLVFITNWRGFGVQKQRALAYATGDFVLNLDADEWISDKLRNVIQTLLISPTADAYRIPIRMCFQGKILKFGSSPTRHARLFRRDGARFSPDTIHEKIILPEGSKVRQLRSPIMHESFYDLSHAVAKMNRYSSASAACYNAEQRAVGIVSALCGAAWIFARCYILQAGFLDGGLGLVFAFMQAEGSWYRRMKQIYPDGAPIAMNTDE